MTTLKNANNELMFLEKLNGPWRGRVLLLYLAIVLGHWSEHLAQVYQVYILGWVPAKAGGILGLYFPILAQSEVLHIVYNGSMWLGLVLLLRGMSDPARKWWLVTLVLQSWHLFEHILLQYQYLTGNFFFGATVQTGIGQLLVPRVELHFLYNLIVFIPMMVAYYYCFQHESAM